MTRLLDKSVLQAKLNILQPTERDFDPGSFFVINIKSCIISAFQHEPLGAEQ